MVKLVLHNVAGRVYTVIIFFFLFLPVMVFQVIVSSTTHSKVISFREYKKKVGRVL